MRFLTIVGLGKLRFVWIYVFSGKVCSTSTCLFSSCAFKDRVYGGDFPCSPGYTNSELFTACWQATETHMMGLQVAAK